MTEKEVKLGGKCWWTRQVVIRGLNVHTRYETLQALINKRGQTNKIAFYRYYSKDEHNS